MFDENQTLSREELQEKVANIPLESLIPFLLEQDHQWSPVQKKGLILVLGRWVELNQKMIKGIISSDMLIREENKLRDSLLILINHTESISLIRKSALYRFFSKFPLLICALLVLFTFIPLHVFLSGAQSPIYIEADLVVSRFQSQGFIRPRTELLEFLQDSVVSRVYLSGIDSVQIDAHSFWVGECIDPLSLEPSCYRSIDLSHSPVVYPKNREASMSFTSVIPGRLSIPDSSVIIWEIGEEAHPEISLEIEASTPYLLTMEYYDSLHIMGDNMVVSGLEESLESKYVEGIFRTNHEAGEMIFWSRQQSSVFLNLEFEHFPEISIPRFLLKAPSFLIYDHSAPLTSIRSGQILFGREKQDTIVLDGDDYLDIVSQNKLQLTQMELGPEGIHLLIHGVVDQVKVGELYGDSSLKNPSRIKWLYDHNPYRLGAGILLMMIAICLFSCWFLCRNNPIQDVVNIIWDD